MLTGLIWAVLSHYYLRVLVADSLREPFYNRVTWVCSRTQTSVESNVEIPVLHGETCHDNGLWLRLTADVEL